MSLIETPVEVVVDSGLDDCRDRDAGRLGLAPELMEDVTFDLAGWPRELAGHDDLLE
jgi:hypothetical protein